ncbi:GAF and ANTAR domain-containing protein [Actinomycetospora cinnamomea]|uniref:Response regulator receiver and ANTAR domain protein n=1 Tax=Actinomycetospora cinnamomea TaxID=663609 RepID=A0A2U1EAX2_9PSEU|nr:GAF and ANTAR domain-containing protein [Actinomycetospora cinnamomea]PVY97098.1 response regulator receiver and ANTAR domain protein [Actinomycetospora cinnamomea]
MVFAEDGARLREFLTTGRRFASAEDVDEVLQLILTAAVDTSPGTDLAGVLLLEGRGRIVSPATTDEVVNELDQVQAEHNEGPCVESIYDDEMVLVQDFSERLDDWPHFAKRALDLDVHGSLSFQLYSEGSRAGSLNLFSRRPHAFGEEDRILGALFANQAGLALRGAQRAAQLDRAVASRDVIGTAKGILMERFGVDDDEAFQRLVRSSQETNIKLVDVARWLVGEQSGKRTANG